MKLVTRAQLYEQRRYGSSSTTSYTPPTPVYASTTNSVAGQRDLEVARAKYENARAKILDKLRVQEAKLDRRIERARDPETKRQLRMEQQSLKGVDINAHPGVARYYDALVAAEQSVANAQGISRAEVREANAARSRAVSAGVQRNTLRDRAALAEEGAARGMSAEQVRQERRSQESADLRFSRAQQREYFVATGRSKQAKEAEVQRATVNQVMRGNIALRDVQTGVPLRYSMGNLVGLREVRPTPMIVQRIQNPSSSRSRGYQPETLTMTSINLLAGTRPPPSPFSRPGAETITGNTIGMLAGTQPNYRPRYTKQEQPLVSYIEEVQRREARREAIIAKGPAFVEKNLGIKGDGYLQKYARLTLSAPYTVPLGIANIPLSVYERSKIVAMSSRVQPGQTRRELALAAKETPGAVGRAYNPLEPEGLFNITLLAAGGALGARGAIRAPVKAGRPVQVLRASQNAKRSLFTERVQLGGMLNRLAGRYGTRTTTFTEAGSARVVLRPDPIFSKRTTITDVFGISGSVRRTVVSGRRARSYDVTGRAVRGEEAFSFSPVAGRTKTVQQSFIENLQKNIIRGDMTRVTKGQFSFMNQFGRGFLSQTSRTVAEVGPTRVSSRTKFGYLGAGEPGSFLSTELTQRGIRFGKKTSKAEIAVVNAKPFIDLERAYMERTAFTARTPAPQSVTAMRTSFEYRAKNLFRQPRTVRDVRYDRRGSLSIGRSQASYDALAELRKTLERPVRVQSPGFPRASVFDMRVPRLALASNRAAVGIFAGQARVSRTAQRQQSIFTAPPRERYAFDMNLAPRSAQSVFQAPQIAQTVFSASRARSSAQQTQQLFPTFGAGAFSFTTATGPKVPVIPPFGLPSGRLLSGGYAAGKTARRGYRYAPDLTSYLFGIRGKKGRKVQRAFTGFEIRPLMGGR